MSELDGNSNVTIGMVPCKPNCRCADCQIERLQTKLDACQRALQKAASEGTFVSDEELAHENERLRSRLDAAQEAARIKAEEYDKVVEHASGMSGLYAREAHKTKVLLEERSRWRAALERIRDARGACDWPSKSPLEWCADQAIEALTGTVVEERGPTIEAAEQFLDDVGSRIVEECQTEGCLLDPGHEGEHRVVEKR